MIFHAGKDNSSCLMMFAVHELLLSIRTSPSLEVFKKNLKTYLMLQAFVDAFPLPIRSTRSRSIKPDHPFYPEQTRPNARSYFNTSPSGPLFDRLRPTSDHSRFLQDLSSTTTSISTRTYRSIHDQYTINKWSILELY